VSVDIDSITRDLEKDLDLSRFGVVPLHELSVKMIQDDAEIREFLEVCVKQLGTSPETAIEVGVWKGGTHIVFRRLFKKVISIEEKDVTALTVARTIVEPERSVMVLRDSASPETRAVLDNHLAGRKVDMLFIDGDHSKDGVTSDWLLYHAFVRRGGIVAFHDTAGSWKGVSEFISELREGRWTEEPLRLIDIDSGARMGISYYVVR